MCFFFIAHVPWWMLPFYPNGVVLFAKLGSETLPNSVVCPFDQYVDQQKSPGAAGALKIS
jgi:hypothetical protein